MRQWHSHMLMNLEDGGACTALRLFEWLTRHPIAELRGNPGIAPGILRPSGCLALGFLFAMP